MPSPTLAQLCLPCSPHTLLHPCQAPSARCWLDPTGTSWGQLHRSPHGRSRHHQRHAEAQNGGHWAQLCHFTESLSRDRSAAWRQHQQSTWCILRHKTVSTSGAAHLPHTGNGNTQLKKLFLLTGFRPEDCWGPCGYLFPFPDRKPKEKQEKTTPLFIFIRVPKQ